MEHLLADHSPFPISTFLSPSSLDFPPKSKVDGLFDGIFVINLRKRRNRRRRLELVFNEWGIEAEFLEAVDGRNLTAADVQRYGMSKVNSQRITSCLYLLKRNIDSYLFRPIEGLLIKFGH